MLVTLAMIVKDEEESIRRTLESIKPFIDRWVIADTGSSDDTKAMVEKSMDGIPGRLIDIQFEDFSSARNKVIDACGTEAKFIIMLDAEDVVVGGDMLRPFLTKTRENALNVRIVSGGSRWTSARIFASGSMCRYSGKVHEELLRPDGSSPIVCVPGLTIEHERSQRSNIRTLLRIEEDIKILEIDPHSNSRSAFHLAMSLETCGRYEEAILAYHSRIRMGGWHEEVFVSIMRIARIKSMFNRSWTECLDLYMQAHECSPRRSEPLYEIARHYNSKGQHASCVTFARRGIDIQMPGDECLFVDESVYAWRIFDVYASSAYWIGDYDMGELCASKALLANPSDKRLSVNLAHYMRRKGQMP